MNRASEQGSFLVFVAAVILPTMFFLFSLVGDLSRYYLENQAVQHALDEAALFGYRFLPDTAAAEVAVRSYLARELPQYAGTVGVDAAPDVLTLTVQNQVLFSFARFFSADLGIPFSAVSRVKGTPLDAFVIVDTSAYLSPDIRTGAPWGDEVSWGAARYFRELNPTPGFELSDQQRLLTQQCFNPIFSRLKRGAALTYSRLMDFSLNAVGLASLPGPLDSAHIARPVLRPNKATGVLGNEVQLEHYYPYYFKGDLACAAAAEQEVEFTHFHFPVESSNAGLPHPRIIPGSWSVDPQYPIAASGAEYIWMQPTNAERSLDFLRALDLVEAELFAAPVEAERKGLVDRAVKTAVLFLGDVA
ncbi:MAG: hypothetical protein KDD62_13535, partial [Bdellovibrionales bacterium]|nr:hypothetical protein [Bdellovibrionales bacterium]